MTDWVILQRLLIISAIAGIIGFERERHGRAAGFRTHILVGIGSCLMMLTGLYLADVYAGRIALDPTRIAAQVVSGLGFLGAGTILRFRASVRGLTTAASLWAIGGIGIAVGAGFISGALMTGVIVVIALFGFSRIERAMRRDLYRTLIVETVETGEELVKIRTLLADHDIEIRDLNIKTGRKPDHVRLEFDLKLVDQPQDEIVTQLLQSKHIMSAHWV